MRWFRSVLVRLRSMVRRHSDERDFNEELASHLAFQIEDYARSGLDVVEARRRAVLKLGGLEAVREAHRERRGIAAIESTVEDIRYAVRSLRRSPGFALVAVATLAVSIGAATSLFSVIDATVLSPLADAQRVVWIQEFSADGQMSGGTPQRMEDWRQAHSLESAAGFYEEGLVLTGQGAPRRVEALRTVGPALQVLQAPLALGRGPTQEEASGREPAAVLSWSLWKARFQGDPQIAGRLLHLGGKAYPVIGVMSQAVRYPEGVDVWIAAPPEVQTLPRRAHFLGEIGRLREGVPLGAAQAEIAAVCERVAQEHPDTDRGRRAQLTPLHDRATAESRTPLLALFWAVTGVLLVACINVAGLLLARALTRKREAALRLALGAGRLRLIRLFLTEGALLSLAGGACGLALAATGIDILQRLLPGDIPWLPDATVNLRAFAFTVTAVTMCALFCGVIPALQMAARAEVGSLHEGARSTSGQRERLRGYLVIAEVAVSVVLLVTAGLLAGSYRNMRHVPLGFRPDQAMSFTVLFPWDTPASRLHAFSTQALERVSSLPGVEVVGIVDRLPLHGESQSSAVRLRGVALPPYWREREVAWRTASPGYFRAAGIAVQQGSVFETFAGRSGPKLAVVNQKFAELFFPDGNPVGQEVAEKEGSAAAEWFRIVGVIANVRQKPSETEAQPEVYVPWDATYWPVMNFVVRTTRPMAAIAREIRETVQPLTTQQAIDDVAPMAALTDETESGPRGRAWLVTCFAVVSTLLAGIGIFGLLTQEVLRRTTEFGVRLALGADPQRLLWDTTLRAMRLVTIGLVLGIGMAAVATRLVESLLFPGDFAQTASYLVAVAVILGISFVSSFVPSVQASRIEPAMALRSE